MERTVGVYFLNLPQIRIIRRDAERHMPEKQGGEGN